MWFGPHMIRLASLRVWRMCILKVSGPGWHPEPSLRFGGAFYSIIKDTFTCVLKIFHHELSNHNQMDLHFHQVPWVSVHLLLKSPMLIWDHPNSLPSLKIHFFCNMIYVYLRPREHWSSTCQEHVSTLWW